MLVFVTLFCGFVILCDFLFFFASNFRMDFGSMFGYIFDGFGCPGGSARSGPDRPKSDFWALGPPQGPRRGEEVPPVLNMESKGTKGISKSRQNR